MKEVAVIEDDPVQSKLLAKGLTDAGFGVKQAYDGEAGLALVLKEHPNLILLDMAMPKMSGGSFLEALRKDGWGKDVPVIVLSNYSDLNKISESLVHGVHHYLLKVNWSVEDVVKKINEVLGTGK